MRIRISDLKQVIFEAYAGLVEADEPATRDEMIDAYSDTYKEKHGIRPRWVRWDELSDAEVEAMLNQIYDETGSVDDHDEGWDAAPPADQPSLTGNNTPAVDDDMDADPFEGMPNKLGMGRRG